jgi:hypothetical protein
VTYLLSSAKGSLTSSRSAVPSGEAKPATSVD